MQTDGPRAPCTHERSDLVALVLPRFDQEMQDLASQRVVDCGACADDRDALRAVVALLDSLEEPADDHEAEQRSVALIERVGAMRNHRRRWSLVAVASSLVVLVAALAGLLWQPPGPDDVQQAQHAETAVSEPIGPGPVTGWLSLGQAGQQVQVDIRVEGLATLPADEGYEAWLTHPDGSVTSIGVIAAAHGVTTHRFVLDGHVDDFVGFWITVEPSPGSGFRRGETVAAVVWAAVDGTYP